MTENVYTVAKRFRRELLQFERRNASIMVQRYGQIWQTLQGELDRLGQQIAAAEATGTEIPIGWLFQEQRAQVLRAQVESELAKFAQAADEQIKAQQRAAVQAALSHSEALAQAAAGQSVELVRNADGLSVLVRPGGLPPGMSWMTLPVDAVETLVGFTADGSPLLTLLNALGPAASEAVQQSLITGLALGYNPRKIARLIRKDMGMGLVRSLRIARTETMRAYREATLRSYQANSNVVEMWEWVASHSLRTCAACLAMDGSLHRLNERLDDHINGRCVAVPKLVDTPQPQRENGQQWLEKQSESDQRLILGNLGYELYADGELTLRDFVGRRRSVLWGTMRYRRSIRSIMGE